jgi:hypothetical protein
MSPRYKKNLLSVPRSPAAHHTHAGVAVPRRPELLPPCAHETAAPLSRCATRPLPALVCHPLSLPAPRPSPSCCACSLQHSHPVPLALRAAVALRLCLSSPNASGVASDADSERPGGRHFWRRRDRQVGDPDAHGQPRVPGALALGHGYASSHRLAHGQLQRHGDAHARSDGVGVSLCAPFPVTFAIGAAGECLRAQF